MGIWFFCPNLAVISAQNLSRTMQVKVAGEGCTERETVFSGLLYQEARIRIKMKINQYVETSQVSSNRDDRA